MVARVILVVAVLLLAASQTEADIHVSNEVSSGVAQDLPLPAADGIFDSFVPNTVEGNASNYFDAALNIRYEDRTALEFNISTIPTGSQIISASLTWLEAIDGATTVVSLRGYGGDGVVTLADAISPPLSTVLFADISNGVVGTMTRDVTSLVSSLFAAGNRFPGFAIRSEVVTAAITERYAFTMNPGTSSPVLTVQYAVQNIPESSSAVAGLLFSAMCLVVGYWKPLRRRI